MVSMPKLGLHLAAAFPQGYHIDQDVIEIAKEDSRREGTELITTTSPEEAVKGADVIVTDTWYVFVFSMLNNFVHTYVQIGSSLGILYLNCGILGSAWGRSPRSSNASTTFRGIKSPWNWPAAVVQTLTGNLCTACHGNKRRWTMRYAF